MGDQRAKLLGIGTGAAVGLLLAAGFAGAAGSQRVGHGGGAVQSFFGAVAGLAIALATGREGAASLRGPALLPAETGSAPNSPKKASAPAPEPFGSPNRRSSRAAVEMPDSPRKMVLLDMPGAGTSGDGSNGGVPGGATDGSRPGTGPSGARQRSRWGGTERCAKSAIAWCVLLCVVEGFAAAPGVGQGGRTDFLAPLEAGLAGPVWALGLALSRAALPGEHLSALLLAVALLTVQPLATLSIVSPGAGAAPYGPAASTLLAFVRSALLTFLAGFVATRVFARARRLAPREAQAGLLWGLLLVFLYQALVVMAGLPAFHPLLGTKAGAGTVGSEGGGRPVLRRAERSPCSRSAVTGGGGIWEGDSAPPRPPPPPPPPPPASSE